jgi:protease-4
MSYSDPAADHLIDRRLLRRKVSFWRLAAFLALLVAIAVGGWRLAGSRNPIGLQSHVARISIGGLITGDRETIKLLDDVAKASSVSAVVLSIESPGGTTTGAERLYDAIRRVSEKKPVVAVVRGMAASGAYIAALAADRIVAQQNSIVGSIGVLFQFPNVSRLLDTIGVNVETIKSSPLKASPNGLEPTTPEARAAMAALVSDSFAWFKDLVKDRRHLQDDELARVADGRIFTGRQGIDLKLVDALGEERDAIKWLESEKKIAVDLPIRDWRPDRRSGALGFFGATADVADVLGFSTTSNLLRRLETANQLSLLDGLVAIWQGGVIN